MNEKVDFLLSSFELHLGYGKHPREAWCLAAEDYAFVYGPNADPERRPLSLAAERALKCMRESHDSLDTEQGSGDAIPTVGLEEGRAEGMSAADSAGEQAVVCTDSAADEINMTGSVVRDAADECVAAVLSFLEYHEEHMQTEEPQAVHWTIAKLLEAGRSYRDAIVEPDEVERIWHEFWRPLVTSEITHVVSLDLIKRELYDYHVMMGEVSKVYDAVTGGQISKPNTCAEAFIAEFEDHLNRLVAEGIADEAECSAAEGVR